MFRPFFERFFQPLFQPLFQPCFSFFCSYVSLRHLSSHFSEHFCKNHVSAIFPTIFQPPFSHFRTIVLAAVASYSPLSSPEQPWPFRIVVCKILKTNWKTFLRFVLRDGWRFVIVAVVFSTPASASNKSNGFEFRIELNKIWKKLGFNSIDRRIRKLCVVGRRNAEESASTKVILLFFLGSWKKVQTDLFREELQGRELRGKWMLWREGF